MHSDESWQIEGVANTIDWHDPPTCHVYESDRRTDSYTLDPQYAESPGT